MTSPENNDFDNDDFDNETWVDDRPKNPDGSITRFCSFCQASQHERKAMFEQAAGVICNECIDHLYALLHGR